jgi:hypothetical protein
MANAPVLYEGSEALKYCTNQGLACGGVTSMGSSQYWADNESNSPRLRFTLLAYDTVDNATAGMKNLIASRHTDKGGKVKTLTIKPGADATDAYGTDDSSTAIMRVGTVLAYVVGTDGTKPGDLQKFAKLQVDRIKATAAGKNPDA